MQKIYSFIFSFLPSKKDLKKAIAHFSKKEYIVFMFLLIVLLVSSLVILERINKSLMTEVPMQGGSLSEGIVGTPRFINPVLAYSDVDQDMISLIYSGLMRKNTNGMMIPDLAEKYKVSKDGLTYTFTLKDDAYFHDGTKVTADDVVFTINKVKDPVIKSPRRGSWDGVSVEKIDDRTVKFALKQPYASFLENTTLGILPAHIWDGSPIELNGANVQPIGSGPFEIKKVSKESTGLINYYELAPFNKFVLGKPYIKTFTLRFYPNEEGVISALESGNIDQMSSITPANAEALKEKDYRIGSLTLPRIFGLFFNQNQNQIFTDKKVVQAINLAIDKSKIIKNVLLGYGVIIDDPIPKNMINYERLNANDVSSTLEKNLEKANDILAKDGWKKGADGYLSKTVADKKKKKTTITPLEFSISTGNASELANSALLIKEDLAKIGIRVNIKTFEIGNLNQGVIRPRKYDSLLFGEIINRESDLFAFWHSSQRKDPGLNVAMYTNAKVDKILEDAFITADESVRIKKYAQFEDEIQKDMPAVFLYSPNFIYVVSKNLQGFSLDYISNPSDRFSDSYKWYVKTDNVWKIFSNSK